MSVDAINWLFDPGEILVSPDALDLLGSWNNVYDLVETKHVKGNFGYIDHIMQQKNHRIIEETKHNKGSRIISIHRINGWNVVITTLREQKLTSVKLEIEK